jgi:hypothetical protein
LATLSLIGLALAGFIGGAIFMTAVVFVGIKLNLKGVGTAAADLRQDAGFYRAWALMGGAQQRQIIMLLLCGGARPNDKNGQGKTVDDVVIADWMREFFRNHRR